MCHARDAILVCLDHRIPVLWKRDVSTLGLYDDDDDNNNNSKDDDNGNDNHCNNSKHSGNGDSNDNDNDNYIKIVVIKEQI